MFGEVRLLILSIRNSLNRCKTNVSGNEYFCTRSFASSLSKNEYFYFFEIHLEIYYTILR